MSARVLLVEDDELLGGSLVRALAATDYEPLWARTVAAALGQVAAARPDLALVDLGLPDGEGIDLVRALLQAEPALPVIILTARSEEADVVVGLHAGAVDYVTKPFRLAELLARVRAHLRTSAARVDEPDVRVVGDLRVATAAHRVWVSEREILLRPKEYDLLARLVADAGRLITREQLLSDVWDEHWFGSSKTLDVHMAGLRRKLGEAPGQPSRITVVRGVDAIGWRPRETSAGAHLGRGLFAGPRGLLRPDRADPADDVSPCRCAGAAARAGDRHSTATGRGWAGGRPDDYRQSPASPVRAIQRGRPAGVRQRPGDGRPGGAHRACGAAGEGIVGDEVVAALPLHAGSAVTGAVRAAEPSQEGTERLLAALFRLSLLAAAALGAAALAGWLLFRRLLRPLDRLRASAVRLGDGDFTTVVSPTGIVELDEVGATLNSSNQRLSRLIDRERNFSAAASHELRTPVAALRVAFEAELLAPRADPTRILHDGLAALDRLESTVQSLLRLARDQPLDRGVLAVAELLDSAGQRWRPIFAKQHRDLSISPTWKLPPVRISAAAIGHVLDVLIDNALRHGQGTVMVKAVAAADGVAVQVTDQAEMSPVIVSALFCRRGRADGHGIGLGLARTLTEAEGGRLGLANASPTTFEVVLPAAAPELGQRTPR